MNPDPQQQRYAPPTATVADVAEAGSTELGGRFARFGAALLDGAILFGLLWVVGLLTKWKVADVANAGFFEQLGYQLMSFALFMLVNGLLLARDGRTVGKKLLGLRIVRSDGTRADAPRLIGLRYALWWLIAVLPIAGMVLTLLDALAIFRPSRRCLHDLTADTIVVKA